MSVEGQAYARAGLLGNPSDGYHGKILAISVKNFAARVFLDESPRVIIRAPREEDNTFPDLGDLVEKIRLFGYYGGVRLIKAGIKRFCEFCQDQGIPLSGRNFTLSYTTSIPRQLGLGGSSAIITAVMRALQVFYSVDIPQPRLPTLVLEAELQELGINAGFMDRVIQVYEGCVYMDLDEDLIREQGFGLYEPLDPSLLPPLYLAFKPELGKVSGRVLNPIREGYARGDRGVTGPLLKLAALAEEGRAALLAGDHARFHSLMDENFELRSRIMPISEENLALVQAARRCGASAKFAGSGGSIIGMYEDETMYENLTQRMAEMQAIVIKPQVV
jgi:glucuronokinase